jgi:Flp pilus assembly protein TadD
VARLSAFVGHSFSQADEDVVAAILEMLDTISKAMPDFEWDHALEAEPKVLSQKVREKMEGRNLFIGICTAKEKAINPSALRKRRWFGREELVGATESFQSKTSDWVIQEIGMAFGRGMDIILLIEDGVRSPGGLQGDLEYIPFSREQPEKLLNKIVNMLRTLAPVAVVVGRETQSSTSNSEAIKPAPEERVPAFLVPDVSWTPERFALAYKFSIEFARKNSEQQIVEAFNRSELSKDEYSQAEFQAAGVSGNALAHGTPWVEPLQTLTKRYPNAPGPYGALAERYAAAGDHVQAARHYVTAAELARTTGAKLSWLINASEQNHKGRRSDLVAICVSQISAIVRENAELEVEGMVQLATLWKTLGETPLFMACAERALELAPDRTHPRFDLARAYSDAEEEGHALFHYRQYLALKSDDSGALNNLGVAAMANDLPISGIEAYREAEKQGNTLASSNLAYALLAAGFLSDAVEVCDRGLENPEPDPRLLDAKAQCERARTKESELEEKVLEGIARRRSIAQRLGKASIETPVSSVPLTWHGPRHDLTAKITGQRLLLEGKYLRPRSALTIGLGLGPEAVPVQVTYEGKLIGRAFVGTVKRNEGGRTTSLLGADEAECVGIIDEKGTRLELFENYKKIVEFRAS